MRTFLSPARVIAALLIVTLGAAGAPGAGAQGRGGQAPPGGGRGRGAAPPARDARPADDTPAGTSSIVGTVVVAGSGTPGAPRPRHPDRRGAAVQPRRQRRRRGAVCVLRDCPRAASRCLHRNSDTCRSTYGQRLPGQAGRVRPIQLEDGQRLTIRLQMPRGGVIGGTVLDEHGDAAVRNRRSGSIASTARAACARRKWPATMQPTTAACTGSTACQLGDYLVAAIPRPQSVLGGAIADRIQEAVSTLAPPGQGGSQLAAAVLDRLSAVAGRCAGAAARRRAKDATTGYAPVFYPGTSNSSGATTLALNAGEEKLGVDFQLQLVSTARVEGMVDLSGQRRSPAGVSVQLVNMGDDIGGLGGSSARVDRDGHFTSATSPRGSTPLFARTGGGGPMVAVARRPARRARRAGRWARSGRSTRTWRSRVGGRASVGGHGDFSGRPECQRRCPDAAAGLLDVRPGRVPRNGHRRRHKT